MTNKVIKTSFVAKKKGELKNYGASTTAKTPANYQCRCIIVNEVSGHIAVASNDGFISIRENQNDIDNVLK